MTVFHRFGAIIEFTPNATKRIQNYLAKHAAAFSCIFTSMIFALHALKKKSIAFLSNIFDEIFENSFEITYCDMITWSYSEAPG